MSGDATHHYQAAMQVAAHKDDEKPWNDVGSGTENNTPAAHVPAFFRPGQGIMDASDDMDDNAWNEARLQPANTHTPLQVPNILRPGGVARSETNPFRRKPVPQAQDVSQVPMSQLRLDDGTEDGNPWLSVESEAPSPSKTPSVHVPESSAENANSDPWISVENSSQRDPHLGDNNSPVLISMAPEEESPWTQEARPGHDEASVASPLTSDIADELTGDENIWDDLGGATKGKGKEASTDVDQVAALDKRHTVDTRSPLSVLRRAAKAEAAIAEANHQPARYLPPGPHGASSAWAPSRHVDGQSEMYQVKRIRWHDEKSPWNPRTSPILMQNKNGPCPLVALVNALTLTTPADMRDTALMRVLMSRDEVSLNLILDAVFDELMSPRRTKSEDSLPDVLELYSFLQSLHTGMNVNPRFIPTREMVKAYKHTSLTHLDMSERESLIPGTFENTTEMSLYATFSIPLIHGWLPPQSDPAYEALERQAASYEEVQNLLFREEELDEKLGDAGEGLTEEEQRLYEDIINIKIFLEASATQLTPWGIEVIGKAMRPGTFAILFRNDHFGTLYCHPRTGQLLSLVTDAGYRTHAEVVWESLVDVNGERTEYLSGDFRVVSGAANTTKPIPIPGDRRVWRPMHNEGAFDEGAGESGALEQEDRDLALALQLQEEEDDRHRADQDRRRRERVLSEQYIEQQAQRPVAFSRGANGGSGAGPNVRTERRQSGPGAQQVVRPLVPPRLSGTQQRADEVPPPPYEPAGNRPTVGNAHGVGSIDESRHGSRVSLENKIKNKKRDRECVVM